MLGVIVCKNSFGIGLTKMRSKLKIRITMGPAILETKIGHLIESRIKRASTAIITDRTIQKTSGYCLLFVSKLIIEVPKLNILTAKVKYKEIRMSFERSLVKSCPIYGSIIINMNLETIF